MFLIDQLRKLQPRHYVLRNEMKNVIWFFFFARTKMIPKKEKLRTNVTWRASKVEGSVMIKKSLNVRTNLVLILTKMISVYKDFFLLCVHLCCDFQSPLSEDIKGCGIEWAL